MKEKLINIHLNLNQKNLYEKMLKTIKIFLQIENEKLKNKGNKIFNNNIINKILKI